MRGPRLLVLALALCVPAALPIFASPAAAQQATPLAAPGLVEFLPVGAVVGDGDTATRLHVLALGPTGAPMQGLKAKLSASQGTISGWRHEGGGIHAFDFQPGRVAERTAVTIELKARTPERERVQIETTFDVLPPLADRVEIEAPTDLVVGQGDTADLPITLVGPEGQPLDGAELLVRVANGKARVRDHDGSGRFTARFTPRAVNFPHLALITVADRRQPDEVYGYAVIPLSGQVDYPVLAPTGAQVSLTIADQTYGPATSGPEGRAEVPVVVPPGEQTATATTVADGQSTDEPIDLRVPSSKRVALFPLPASAPADAAVPVRLLVRTPRGEADTGADVAFEVDAGSISKPTHLGDGIYEATLSPPAGEADVTITARLAGQDKQVEQATLSVVPAAPARLELVAEPEVMEPGQTELSVVAELTDAQGQPVAEPAVRMTGGGAKLQGEPELLGEGRVRATFQTNPAGPVEILGRAEAAPTGAPPRHLVVLPARDRLANDGASGTPVLVLATDRHGHPVPGVTVSLDAVGADGRVTSSVTTDATGIGLVLYQAGSEAGLAAIRARVGNLHAAAPVLQVPATVAPVRLPAAGGPAQIAVTEAWQERVALLRVEHAGEVAPGWDVAGSETDPEVEAALADADDDASDDDATPEPNRADDHPSSERPPKGHTEPWARGRASYVVSSYWYEQSPEGDGGPLIDDIFAVGGERGSRNAIPQGFEIDARGWLPAFDYVGAHARYRATYYGVTAEAFGDQVARDALHDISLDVLGRYPFQVDRSRFHVGARVGFHLADFIYFTEEQQDDRLVYRYDTLAVPGLYLGGEIGADVGRAYLIGSLGRTLAYFRNGYATVGEIHVGYDLADNLAIDLGFEQRVRSIQVVGSESGEVRGQLDDGQILFTAGIGAWF